MRDAASATHGDRLYQPRLDLSPSSRTSGARYLWSSKVKNKTVSLALSEQQADWLEQAIAEHRKLKKFKRRLGLTPFGEMPN